MSGDANPGDRPKAEVPNPWPAPAADGANPYLHNVFVLLGLDPDAGEREFENTRKKLSHRFGANDTIEVHGRRLDETDLTKAHRVAADEAEFVAERLLAHTHHRIDVKRFEPATKAIEAAPFDAPAALLPLAVRDLSFLTALLPDPGDVAAGEAVAVPRETLADLFRPNPGDERALDL